MINDSMEYGKMHAGNNKKRQEKEGMDKSTNKSMQCYYKSNKTEMAVGQTCSKKNRPSLDQGDTRLDHKRYKATKKDLQEDGKMKLRNSLEQHG